MDFTFTITVPADKKEAFFTDFLIGLPIPTDANGQPEYTREDWVKHVAVRYLNALRNNGIDKVFNADIDAQIAALQANTPEHFNDAV